MSDDLVEQLRGRATDLAAARACGSRNAEYDDYDAEIDTMAADEIERLDAALREIGLIAVSTMHDIPALRLIADIVRAALTKASAPSPHPAARDEAGSQTGASPADEATS